MYGLICNDKIEDVGHCLFLNFRQALYNTFNKNNFKDIKEVSELCGLTHLFIIDEHYSPNVNIWKKQELIDKVNNLNIKVIIFNFEKIFNSAFPWNINHQKFVEQFRNLNQFLTDMEDLKILKTPFINKQLLSKDTYITKRNNNKITDKVLFIGQTEGECYQQRRRVIDSVSRFLPLEIINTKRHYSYDEFLDILSSYKFVLNPLGAGNFLNLRYYEILKQGGIPIQQVVPDMKKMYNELNNNYSINFINSDELNMHTLNEFQQNKQELFLEDYFEEVSLKRFVN